MIDGRLHLISSHTSVFIPYCFFNYNLSEFHFYSLAHPAFNYPHVPELISAPIRQFITSELLVEFLLISNKVGSITVRLENRTSVHEQTMQMQPDIMKSLTECQSSLLRLWAAVSFLPGDQQYKSFAPKIGPNQVQTIVDRALQDLGYSGRLSIA